MQSLSLKLCAATLDGELIVPDSGETRISSISTDTRTLNPGDTFVALVGPNHDAHSHCQLAVEKGANALIVSHQVDCQLPQLVVADTRLALGSVARLWASMYQVPLVAVTGSNGKTTVKEMVRSILGELGSVLATQGNLNNEIGVPLTLLRLREEHQYAVIEMGANHVGEIGYLSKLASPSVALVNNVSSAHLEGFGSLDAIAHAKSEIFSGVDANGYAVINADDGYAELISSAAAHCQRINFGFTEDAEVRGSVDEGVFTITLGSITIQPALQLLGEHNRRNALAAAAIARCLDVQPETIKSGLEKVTPVAGRLQRRISASGFTVIDDSYNANPASAVAAIKVLAEMNGQRVLVLGDMRELGDGAENLHAEVGNSARELGVHKLYAVGPLAAHAAHAFGENGVSFSDKHEMLKALQSLAADSPTFLVKGSRGSQMEEVVEGLLSTHGNGTRDDAGCEVSLS